MTGLDNSTLVAYVDGELDAEQARAVKATLTGDPEARSRVEIFHETAALLRAAFEEPAGEPVSPNLLRAAKKPEVVRRRWRVALPLAASLAALAIGLGGGYMTGVYRTQAQIEVAAAGQWQGEAAEYFRLYAQNDRHLIELPAGRIEAIEAKLSHFVNKKLTVPDLSSRGLKFRGARLFAIDGDPAVTDGAQAAALLVYDLPNGKPLALCIAPFASETGEYPVAGRSGDMNLFSWYQSGQGYVLMGWAEPEFLREVGMELAYRRNTS